MSLINNPAPEAVPLSRAPAVFGISRSALYRLASMGQIRMFKIGGSTLVDAGSIRDFIAQQPNAEFRRDPRRSQPIGGSNLVHSK
ncbi:MAG: DNA-binding protein [Methylocystaceae bacterium]|nr:DNA-binding protein [Methylocystaceae bacterium]